MRVKGRITQWKDDKGFGFLAPARAGQVFFHIKDFVRRSRRPAIDEVSETQSKKRSFITAFWTTVTFNCGGLLYLTMNEDLLARLSWNAPM